MSEENKKEQIRPPTLVEKQKTSKPQDPKQGPAVDVNSSLTPITRQEIKDVFGDKWEDMSVGQLHDQLAVMEQRLLYAQQLSNDEIYKQVLAGVNRLKSIIIEKTPDEIKLV